MSATWLKTSLLAWCSLHALACTAQVMQPGDESGTLVIAARTDSFVVIAADSLITKTASGSDSQTTLTTDPNRKLVEIGPSGACAIDGYTGFQAEHENVANDLREWTHRYPRLGPATAMGTLLHVAASTWNKRNFNIADILPNGRRVGAGITFLTCGDWVNGAPVIVRGATFVLPTFRAGTQILGELFNDRFYVGGVLDTECLHRDAADGKENCIPVTSSYQSVYDVAIRDTKEDAASNEALRSWSGAVPSTWSQASVMALIRGLYISVERLKPTVVGPPNNVRVIRSCGRITTVTESLIWPPCPAATR